MVPRTYVKRNKRKKEKKKEITRKRATSPGAIGGYLAMNTMK